MKHAIIPDVHQELTKLGHMLRAIEAKGIKSKIFLGDWFDAHKCEHDHIETAKFLRDLIETEPFATFLWGNHDFPYWFSPKVFRCPGFTYSRSIEIKNYLQARHWNVFKLAHKVGKYWCSHAGMHQFMLHPIRGLSDEHIQFKCSEALGDARNNNRHPWLSWGEDRGGEEQKYGGIIWLDFNRSFVPIDNLNQIVGHSIAWKPRHIWTSTSDNWCIDTKLDDFLVVDDETNTVELFNTFGLPISINDPKQVAGREFKTGMDKLFIRESSREPRPTVKLFS